MTKKNKNISIWLNDTLAPVKEYSDKEGISLSKRLSEIVERYDAIILNTEVPDLTENEISMLSEVLMGSEITPIKIRYIADEIELSSIGSEEERKNFAKKIKDWSPAEVIAFLEEYNV